MLVGGVDYEGVRVVGNGAFWRASTLSIVYPHVSRLTRPGRERTATKHITPPYGSVTAILLLDIPCSHQIIAERSTLCVLARVQRSRRLRSWYHQNANIVSTFPTPPRCFSLGINLSRVNHIHGQTRPLPLAGNLVFTTRQVPLIQ